MNSANRPEPNWYAAGETAPAGGAVVPALTARVAAEAVESPGCDVGQQVLVEDGRGAQ